MKILILKQGVYGERIVENMRNKAPVEWSITTFDVPTILEPILDEPEIYVPDHLQPADLILHLGESAQAAQLLPTVAEITGANAVIASIDTTAWIPLGLRNQLRRELSTLGVTIVFPEPLCSIDEDTVGFNDSIEPYTNETIRQFSRVFGKPILEVKVDCKGKISEIEVLRSAPCGSTEYTVKRVLGMAVEQAVPTSGLMCLHYPCLASMTFEQKANGVDTIMHNSGRIFNEGMENALKKVTE